MHADFKDSGGIFTNAEVTYRGVTVGKVGALRLISSPTRPSGRARRPRPRRLRLAEDPGQLAGRRRQPVGGRRAVRRPAPAEQARALPRQQLGDPDERTPPVPTADRDNCSSTWTTSSSRSGWTTCARRSASSTTRWPVAATTSANLLDASDQLLQSALEPQNVAATLDLIDTSSTVLSTQLDEQQPLQSWAHSLNLLSQQLKASDPDIRRLFDNGPGRPGHDQQVHPGQPHRPRRHPGQPGDHRQRDRRHLTASRRSSSCTRRWPPAARRALYNRAGRAGLGARQRPRATRRTAVTRTRARRVTSAPSAGTRASSRRSRPNVAARCTAPISSRHEHPRLGARARAATRSACPAAASPTRG